MHTCVASLSRERVRVKEEEEETDSGGKGRESKQNLHGNSVPVGRVELWVFNAVLSLSLALCSCVTLSLFPPTNVLPLTSTASLYPSILHLFLAFSLPFRFFPPRGLSDE